jgi:hypothetical protein
MERNRVEAALPIVESLDVAITRYLSGLAPEADTLRAVRGMSAQLDGLLEGRAREMLRAIDKHTSMVFEAPAAARQAAFPLPYIGFVRIQLAKHVWALKSHLREVRP